VEAASPTTAAAELFNQNPYLRPTKEDLDFEAKCTELFEPYGGKQPGDLPAGKRRPTKGDTAPDKKRRQPTTAAMGLEK
jgi:hypothetical protein